MNMATWYMDVKTPWLLPFIHTSKKNKSYRQHASRVSVTTVSIDATKSSGPTGRSFWKSNGQGLLVVALGPQWVSPPHRMSGMNVLQQHLLRQACEKIMKFGNMNTAQNKYFPQKLTNVPWKIVVGRQAFPFEMTPFLRDPFVSLPGV